MEKSVINQPNNIVDTHDVLKIIRSRHPDASEP